VSHFLKKFRKNRSFPKAGKMGFLGNGGKKMNEQSFNEAFITPTFACQAYF
jgi:hypothetical protein